MRVDDRATSLPAVHDPASWFQSRWNCS